MLPAVKTVWAYKKIPECNCQLGFVQLPRAQAEALLAKGDVEDPLKGELGITEPDYSGHCGPTTPQKPGDTTKIELDGTPTHQKVDIKWDPVPAASEYKVEGIVNNHPLPEVSITVPKYSFANLNGGETLKVMVKACNAGGCSAGKEATFTAPAAPQPPDPIDKSKVTVTHDGTNKTVTLDWPDVPGATEYARTVFINGHQYDWSPVKTSDMRVTGADPGNVYKFVLSACNGNLCSSTIDIDYTVPAIPATPANLADDGMTATELKLKWDQVAEAANYKVEWTIGADTTKHDSTVSVPNHTITGLSASDVVHVSLTACNESGCSAPATKDFTLPAT